MNPLLWIISLPFRAGQRRWDRQNPSIQRPAPAASPPRVPAPNPGEGLPQVPPTPQGGKPSPGQHGGIITTVDIYADGRTEITDHRKGAAEIFPGDCPQCQDGACSLCGFYPVYDPARGRYAHRYQACPAHAEQVQP